MPRRPCRKRQCLGRCGVVMCAFSAERRKELFAHLRVNRAGCPLCVGRSFTTRASMLRHFRTIHGDYTDDDGGCVRLNIPRRRAAVCVRFDADAFDARHDLHTDAETRRVLYSGYAYVVKSVKNHLMHDVKKGSRYASSQLAYARHLLSENGACHRVASEIVAAVVRENLLLPGSIDHAGGRLPSGFILRSHGGVFALSLDRIDHDRAHFLDGKRALANVRLIAAGLNTQVNIVEKHGKATCSVIATEVSRHHTREEENSVIAAEQVPFYECGVTRVLNQSYRCCKSAFRNSGSGFGTLDGMHRHTLRILAEQRGRCAISGVLLRGHVPGKSACYRMSLDAKDPVLGHVPDNLRWVCRFLNSTNNDKKKTYTCAEDPPSAWSKPLFMRYIGRAKST